MDVFFFHGFTAFPDTIQPGPSCFAQQNLGQRLPLCVNNIEDNKNQGNNETPFSGLSVGKGTFLSWHVKTSAQHLFSDCPIYCLAGFLTKLVGECYPSDSMPIRRERWTRINVPVTLEAPRATHRFSSLFVSPGGLFIPTALTFDPSMQMIVRFTVEGRNVVAHAEVRRLLSASSAQERGIEDDTGGVEMRIVRMEGDGSQILAEHIKKILMESGGPV